MYGITRPYKLNFMNGADILILFLIELLSLVTSHTPLVHFSSTILISSLLLLVPHVVLIVYICYVLAKKAGITQCLKRKYKTLKRCLQSPRSTHEVEADMEAESDTGSLPDRLVNPGVYEPLIPTTDKHTAAEPTENKEPVNKEPRRLTPVYTYGSIN